MLANIDFCLCSFLFITVAFENDSAFRLRPLFPPRVLLLFEFAVFLLGDLQQLLFFLKLCILVLFQVVR